MEAAGTTSVAAMAVVPTETPSTKDYDDAPVFDPSLSEEERRFYVRAYPNVDLVRERKVHCTTCKIHVGTAPSQEENIRMHPVLRVTHCLKCHDFYNSGEFSKGEDGSELYCRWCGQGGEVYCCSSCPYVFCKSCIVKNLSRGVVVDIEQNENWNCFSCAPKILWPLRAQHWALIRYIDKQKKYIESGSYSEAEKKNLWSQDRSTCCRLAKSKCGNMSDSLESLDSTASRRSHGSASAKKQSKSPGSSSHTPPAKRAKTSNDEVVCTPDLMSMLEPDCQLTVQSKSRPSAPTTSTPKIISLQTHHATYSGGVQIKAHTNTPPPLVLRNTGLPMRHPSPTPVVRRTVIGARNNTTPVTGSSHTPVYHTINGYRIDLNSAAQQETFRLPNGKLIQVKRQGTNSNLASGNQSPNNPWMRQPSPITTIQHAAAGRPIQIAPASAHATQHYYTVQQQQQQNTMHQPQMLRYSNTTVTPVGGQNGAVRNAQIQLVNGIPVAPTAQPTAVAQAPNVATTVRAPLMVRHVFPDTAIGQARTQLQDQVFNAMEICQHLTGKVQTLTNSNAYKQARNYLEVKELYIHLSYLLTYAIGRFKGLQDKCLGDMRQLGFVSDADSLENGQLAADKQASDDEDNEIEIVEPQTDTITLDSDNEEDGTTTNKQVTPKKPTTVPNNNATTNAASLLRQNLTEGNINQSPYGNELLMLPNSTTASAAAISTMPGLSNLTSFANTRGITVNKPADKMEEVDMMTAARTFLVSLLEVDSDQADGGSDSQQKPKQPRKKTTNKPNPTLLKQKEMLERERLEEMKRNDQKLKMKCAISLKKAEEEFPFAKDMLEKHESLTKTDREAANKETDEKMEMENAEDAKEKPNNQEEVTEENKKQNDSGEVEILTVELESSADDGKEDQKSASTEKSEADNNSKQYTIVMGGDDDDDDDEDVNSGNKSKSLIIEVEGGSTSNEKEPLKVVIDAESVDADNVDKVSAASEKPANKEKFETVSECAKRVIESVKASEKKAEMEKKEQAIKVAALVTPTTTTTTTLTLSTNDNKANGDSSADIPADDTIEPIMIEETDISDSIESPIKVRPQTGCDNVEKAFATKEKEDNIANIEKKDDAAAFAEDKTKTELPAVSNIGENKYSTSVVAAAEQPTPAAELNEPEIDVEKEIEKLLSKVPEETAADNGASDAKTIDAVEIQITQNESAASQDTEMAETQDTTTATATTTITSTTTTSEAEAPELITELVNDLIESASAATAP
ncbi:serine-rich adhesin for platelets isoform X1 [Eurosta solidaginis]|uniref:serine-rich adhesin for platelets isoform X1 n=1 Tax=Eurosta solidaginis TaxID=178769 RepID=UPI003530BE10